jgi:hypothetical protein
MKPWHDEEDAAMSIAEDTTTPPHRSFLYAGSTTVEVEYGDPDDVLLQVTSEGSDTDAHAGAGLLGTAVAQARSRHTRRVRTVLDASSPACWTYLEALRARVGDDVATIALRRAGSSVLVTLDLMPPRASRVAGRPAAGVAPAGRPSPHPRTRTATPHHTAVPQHTASPHHTAGPDHIPAPHRIPAPQQPVAPHHLRRTS